MTATPNRNGNEDGTVTAANGPVANERAGHKNGPVANGPVAFARTAACGILTDTAPGAGPVSQR